MIDTDKYEGHTENKWVWYEFNDGDWILCPLHDDVKSDPDDMWWGLDEKTEEPLDTHDALNWNERILDLSSDCMTGNNDPTRKDFVYCSHSSVRLPRKRADMNLIQDAPLLLAEVKRLRKVNDELQGDLEQFIERVAEDEAGLKDELEAEEAEVNHLRKGIKAYLNLEIETHELKELID